MKYLILILLLCCGCVSPKELRLQKLHEEFPVNYQKYEGTLHWPEYKLNRDTTGVELESETERFELDLFVIADEPKIYTLLANYDGKKVRLMGVPVNRTQVDSDGLLLPNEPKIKIVLVLGIKLIN